MAEEQEAKLSRVWNIARKHPIKFASNAGRIMFDNIKNPKGRKTFRENSDVEYTSSTLMQDASGEEYYRITMQEQEGKEAPWWKKALERDSSIGMSLGGLIAMTATGLGAAGIPLLGSLATGGIAITVLGGVIGAASDYFRNKNELENGVDIKKPQFINRDMLKSGMFVGLFALGVTTLALTGIAALGGGAALPIVGAAMSSASSALASGSGIGAVWTAFNIVREAVVTAPLLAAAVYSVGAAIGGVRGAEAGYKRMEEQYQRAEFKNKHPQARVLAKSDFAQEEGLIEAIAPVSALGINTASPEPVYAETPAANVPANNIVPSNLGGWAERVGSKAQQGQGFVSALNAERAGLATAERGV
jgi:hypothetical protein